MIEIGEIGGRQKYLGNVMTKMMMMMDESDDERVGIFVGYHIHP